MAQDPEIEKLDITDELIAERRSGAPGDTQRICIPSHAKLLGILILSAIGLAK